MNDQAFLKRLESERENWVQAKIISEEQSQALIDHCTERASQRPFVGVVALIGAILLGIGVIAFFASNFPSGLKLPLLFLALLLSYVVGFRLKYRGTHYHGTGDALLLLGSLLYGAGIFLIAQGYHINANEPSLLLLWFMGTLPLAYLVQSKPIMFLSVLLLSLLFPWDASYWLEQVNNEPKILTLSGILGILLYALGNLHNLRGSMRVHRNVYSGFGLFLLFSAVFLLSFGDIHMRHQSLLLPMGALIRFWVLVGITLLTVVICLVLQFRSLQVRAENTVLITLTLLGCPLFYSKDYNGIGLIANLLLLALIVATIVLGYQRREPLWINIGFLYLALLIIARYFDWLWGLLDKSLFFMGAGTILIVGGILLERARRKALSGFTTPKEATS